MSTTAHLSRTSARIVSGAVAVMVGGVVFGVLMAMMGHAADSRDARRR